MYGSMRGSGQRPVTKESIRSHILANITNRCVLLLNILLELPWSHGEAFQAKMQELLALYTPFLRHYTKDNQVLAALRCIFRFSESTVLAATQLGERARRIFPLNKPEMASLSPALHDHCGSGAFTARSYSESFFLPSSQQFIHSNLGLHGSLGL